MCQRSLSRPNIIIKSGVRIIYIKKKIIKKKPRQNKNGKWCCLLGLRVYRWRLGRLICTSIEEPPQGGHAVREREALRLRNKPEKVTQGVGGTGHIPHTQREEMQGKGGG